ncbi:hypothetical protein QFZ51_001108 [Chitinophaga sp. W3I9]
MYRNISREKNNIISRCLWPAWRCKGEDEYYRKELAVEINDPDARIVDFTMVPEGNIAGRNTWIFIAYCINTDLFTDGLLHFSVPLSRFITQFYQWCCFPAGACPPAAGDQAPFLVNGYNGYGHTESLRLWGKFSFKCISIY